MVLGKSLGLSGGQDNEFTFFSDDTGAVLQANHEIEISAVGDHARAKYSNEESLKTSINFLLEEIPTMAFIQKEPQGFGW